MKQGLVLVLEGQRLVALGELVGLFYVASRPSNHVGLTLMSVV